MYKVTILAEVASPLRPEEMITLTDIEFKIEDQVGVGLQTRFGYVRILNVEVEPTRDATGEDISESPKSL